MHMHKGTAFQRKGITPTEKGIALRATGTASPDKRIALCA